LTDRVEGKPKEKHEHTGKDGKDLAITVNDRRAAAVEEATKMLTALAERTKS